MSRKNYSIQLLVNAFGRVSKKGISLIPPSLSHKIKVPFSSKNSERNCLQIPHGYVYLSDELTIAISTNSIEPSLTAFVAAHLSAQIVAP